MNERPRGFTVLMLLFMATILSIGLMVAVPFWETEIRREKEEELIFRGLQYVEAIRLFQKNNPGRYPQSLEDLSKQKCIRRLFRDPMTEDGVWRVILLPPDPTGQEASGSARLLIASPSALRSIPNPRIIGVVSASRKASIKIFNKQETYDRWLFFIGMGADNIPEVEEFGT